MDKPRRSHFPEGTGCMSLHVCLLVANCANELGQTDRQKEIQTDSQRDIQADRQTDIKTVSFPSPELICSTIAGPVLLQLD